MSDDLTALLEQWPYDPGELRVRLVDGGDGRQKIQMRIDLGILQMEVDGRPDGTRPEDQESWLEYYEQQERDHSAANPDTAFVLSEADCARLWREGVQYYHRYLSLWHLERFDLCARDTARNLRLFAFVRQHVTQDRYKLQFDQWRPYVTMMHARALATPLVRAEKYAQALKHVEAGIDAIRDFLDEYGQGQRAEQCVELVDLEQWRDSLQREQPRPEAAEPEDAMESLRRRLQEAISAEQFEEAARLRDEIRRLTESAP